MNEVKHNIWPKARGNYWWNTGCMAAKNV